MHALVGTDGDDVLDGIRSLERVGLRDVAGDVLPHCLVTAADPGITLHGEGVSAGLELEGATAVGVDFVLLESSRVGRRHRARTRVGPDAHAAVVHGPVHGIALVGYGGEPQVAAETHVGFVHRRADGGAIDAVGTQHALTDVVVQVEVHLDAVDGRRVVLDGNGEVEGLAVLRHLVYGVDRAAPAMGEAGVVGLDHHVIDLRTLEVVQRVAQVCGDGHGYVQVLVRAVEPDSARIVGDRAQRDVVADGDGELLGRGHGHAVDRLGEGDDERLRCGVCGQRARDDARGRIEREAAR